MTRQDMQPEALESFFPKPCTPMSVLAWLEGRDVSWLWLERDRPKKKHKRVWDQLMTPNHLHLAGWDVLWDKLLSDPFGRAMLHQEHLKNLLVLMHNPRGPALTFLREKLGQEGSRAWWSACLEKSGRNAKTGNFQALSELVSMTHAPMIINDRADHRSPVDFDINDRQAWKAHFAPLKAKNKQVLFDMVEDLVKWEGLDLNATMDHTFVTGRYSYHSSTSVGAMLSCVGRDTLTAYVTLEFEDCVHWFLHAQRLGWTPHELTQIVDSAGDDRIWFGINARPILESLQEAVRISQRNFQLETHLPMASDPLTHRM